MSKEENKQQNATIPENAQSTIETIKSINQNNTIPTSKKSKIKKKKRPSELQLNFNSTSNPTNYKFKSIFSSPSSNYEGYKFTKTMQEKAKKYHKMFKKYGLKSLHILDNNIRNVRYPGFSQFSSSNALRNSAYCWSIGNELRIKDKSYKKYNDNIYNIPEIKSKRFTTLGYGHRGKFWVTSNKFFPSPATYKINSIFDLNLMHKKGITFGEKFYNVKSYDKYKPGPGAYNIKNLKKFRNIPIILKSRLCFFYDDDLKKKKATVSMQRYKPKYSLVQMNRFSAITFGIGDRPNTYNINKYPGPGAYKVPGNFDRGYRGKLPLN